MIALVRLQDFPSSQRHTSHCNNKPRHFTLTHKHIFETVLQIFRVTLYITLTNTFACIPGTSFAAVSPAKVHPFDQFFPLQRAPFRTRIANAQYIPNRRCFIFFPSVKIKRSTPLFTDFISRNTAPPDTHYSIWIKVAEEGTGVCVFLCRGCMYVCRYVLHMYDKRGLVLYKPFLAVQQHEGVNFHHSSIVCRFSFSKRERQTSFSLFPEVPFGFAVKNLYFHTVSTA